MIKVIHADQITILAMMIFMLSMLMVYSASTVYHGTKNILHKRIWQKVDHSMVALILAGVSTPLLLIIASGAVATIMLSLIILLTFVNIGLNIICVQRFKKHSLALMGLCVILIIIGLAVDMQNQETGFLVLLLSAFIVILVGGGFYLNKAKKYTHFIWHISNILSTILIFLAFFLFVL